MDICHQATKYSDDMLFELLVNERESASNDKAMYIEEFSRTFLKSHFLLNDYGPDVQNIAIVIILIKTRPGYEKWYKVRQPKYIEYLSGYSVITGEPKLWEWKKRYAIEVRFDDSLFEEFIESNEEEANHILARETLKALDLLDKLPKRLKHFDKERFKNDVAVYYHEQGWI